MNETAQQPTLRVLAKTMAEKKINRRFFLKRTAAATSLAALSTALFYRFRDEGLPLEEGQKSPFLSRKGRIEPPAGKKEQSFTVVHGTDPVQVVAKALEARGGMSRYVSQGESVLIKPNIGWDRPPSLAANTNPLVVRETARLCLEAGASRVTVSDSPCNNPDRCFDRSGIRKALDGLPVDILVPRERDFVEKDFGGVIGPWPVLRVLLETDKVINIPVAKHHSSAVLTMGMKNWFGILGGGRLRGRLHQQMHRVIAELAWFARPDLTLLDAFRVIYRNGPQGGSLRDTRDLNRIAVSADPVAVDAYGATLFERAPEEIASIPLAAGMGLGTIDFHSLDFQELEV